MNWQRSSTGNWVAFSGNTSFVIESLACWNGSKQVRGYRLRINGAAVGGVTGEMFNSVTAVKKYVEEREAKIDRMRKIYDELLRLASELSRSKEHLAGLLKANSAYNAFIREL